MSSVALALPSAGDWDFGDYPYALEPLTLPYPRRPLDVEGPVDACTRQVYRAVLSTAGGHVTEPATTDAELERLFWFRWFTGHHISFILWRLLADHLSRLATGLGDQAERARAITTYVRGYSAMLLYTGSSTPAIYHRTIRPSMYRLHNTFSGTWSADFAPVRSLFRGRRVPPVVESEVENLMAEVRLSHRIHLGVASKLVVAGRSLLQDLVDSPGARQPRMWDSIFDCYFLTLRAPVTGRQVLAQLLRRCKAVTIDLTTNGLYPAVADYPDATPAELRSPDVAECEKQLTDIVVRTAGTALEGHMT